MIRAIKDGFEVVNSKGKVVRSYKVIGTDVIKSTNEYSFPVSSMSTVELAKECLAYYLHREQVKEITK